MLEASKSTESPKTEIKYLCRKPAIVDGIVHSQVYTLLSLALKVVQTLFSRAIIIQPQVKANFRYFINRKIGLESIVLYLSSRPLTFYLTQTLKYSFALAPAVKHTLIYRYQIVAYQPVVTLLISLPFGPLTATSL